MWCAGAVRCPRVPSAATNARMYARRGRVTSAQRGPAWTALRGRTLRRPERRRLRTPPSTSRSPRTLARPPPPPAEATKNYFANAEAVVRLNSRLGLNLTTKYGASICAYNEKYSVQLPIAEVEDVASPRKAESARPSAAGKSNRLQGATVAGADHLEVGLRRGTAQRPGQPP